MTPQFVDLNADGHKDLIAGTFEGTVFIAHGSKDGFAQPVHIKDKAGELVRISMYWDLDASDYLSVDRSSKGDTHNPDHHLTSASTVDWDEDGDLDLLLGAYEGAMYVCKNEGSASSPAFATKNIRVRAGGKPVVFEHGLMHPHVCDWNGDGRFDILCGGAKGGIFLLTNNGKKGDPSFAAPVELIASTLAKEPVDPEDYFSAMMVPAKNGVPTVPGTAWHVESNDYDGDGDLDLLVGALSYFEQEAKVLTKAEEEELAALQTQMDELEGEFSKKMEGLDPEEMEAFWSSDFMTKFNERFGEIFTRMEEINPSPRPANYVWLYRNATTGDNATASAEEE